MIKWNFPTNNDGEIKGFNDSGIATFGSKAYASLAREICQNSLDAAFNNQTVKIEFSKFYLKRNEFFDYNNYKHAIESCYNQTLHFEKDQKPKEFFKESLNIIDDSNISFLRISDFNTSGLTGSDKDYNSNWINLVKSTGSSDKGGQSGGSFGIGKAAPFVCSSLRTVFYSTFDIEGIKATQGIAKLISYQLPSGEFTSGIGYYGDDNRNQPISECLQFQKSFVRIEPGTDIYIAGFIEDDNWETLITMEILSNYFYAIYKGILEVTIENEVINATTLPDIISKYKTQNNKLYNFYQVIISNTTKWYSDDFEGYGDIRLGLLSSNEIDIPKSIAMIRKPWMKINEYSITYPLVGIFIVEGENLNSFLRSLENPSHDKWEPGRAPSKDAIKTAKNIISKIHKYIRDKVKDFFSTEDIENEELFGADEFFQIEDDKDESKPEDFEKDFLSPLVANISQKKVNPRTFNSKKDDSGNYLELEKTEGEIAEGSDLGINKSGGEGKRGKNPALGEYGVSVIEGNGQVPQAKLLSQIDARLICLNKESKHYRLIIKYHADKANCYLDVNKLDEQGGKFPVKIQSAMSEDINLEIKNNRIKGIDLKRIKSTIIDFFVEEKNYFGAEVLVYGFE